MDEEDKQMWRDKDRGDEDRSPSDIDDVSLCVLCYFLLSLLLLLF